MTIDAELLYEVSMGIFVTTMAYIAIRTLLGGGGQQDGEEQ